MSVVKGKVKAETVTPKFTIATSRWFETRLPSAALENMEKMLGVEIKDELRVAPEDIHPWKAETEELVRIGDEVEVQVEIGEKDIVSKEGQESNRGV